MEINHKIIVSLQRIFNSNTYLVMKTGDNVLISPEVTHKSDWT